MPKDKKGSDTSAVFKKMRSLDPKSKREGEKKPMTMERLRKLSDAAKRGARKTY